MEMSSKMQKNPSIRFKGFTDAWEQRKSHEIFQTITDYVANGSFASLRENVSYSKKKDFAIVVRLTDYSNKYKGPFLYTSELGYKFLKKSSLVKGDILISNVGANAGLVYRAPNMDVPMTLGPNSILVRSDGNDTEFLYQMMKTTYGEKKIKEQIGISAQPKFNKTEFRQIDFFLPSNDEQKQIGTMFSQLDKTIALHQRQLDNYKDLKKAMMQKIFNQELCLKDEEGNEYPEWEEKKVSDLFSITRGVVISKPSISEHKSLETPYPVFSSQTSNFGILGWSSEYDFEGLYLTWTTDGAGAGKVFSRTGKFRCTNVCGVLVGKIESYSNSCIKELLEKETPKHVSYVGNPKLMNNVMGQIKITVPSLKEQLAISCLFELFDREILFQENLIEKLREQKEGLMQQMFV